MIRSVLLLLLPMVLTAAPKTPSKLKLVPSTTSVDIYWVDNSDDETGFKIFRDGKLIHITKPSATHFKDKGLKPSTTYTYTVKATDDKNPNLDEDIAWFLDAQKNMKEDYFEGQFGVDRHPGGWDRGAYLRAYIDMYEATRDLRILRNLNELLKIVADGNDILTKRVDDLTGTVMPGWGVREDAYGQNGDARYSDMLTNALFAYPLATFARIVKEDKELADEFGADAKRYYRMVEELYKAHQPFREDNDTSYPDGIKGLYAIYPDNYYEEENGEIWNYSNIARPINMTVIIAEPLIELYRASVADGKPNLKYRDIVEKVANYLWWNMKVKTSDRNDTYLIWDYWPAANKVGDTKRMEDVEHAARTAEFIASLYDAGLQTTWTQKRITYLANTLTFGALKEDKSFSEYIDGTGGAYDNSAVDLYEWLELERFSHFSSRKTIEYYIRNRIEIENKNVKDEQDKTDIKSNMKYFPKFVRYGEH